MHDSSSRDYIPLPFDTARDVEYADDENELDLAEKFDWTLAIFTLSLWELAVPIGWETLESMQDDNEVRIKTMVAYL